MSLPSVPRFTPRRVWCAVLDHVGGFGVLTLVIFGAFAAWMAFGAPHKPWYGAGMLVFWYVQARMHRDKYKKRDEAIEIVDGLEDRGSITTEYASKLRRAIRDE